MTTEPFITVLILNWNGCTDTLACLRTVSAINYSNYRAIVVDNGSSDDSIPAIQHEFPQIEIVRTGKNLGFSGGNNSGIARAIEHGTDFVLLLNNDTKVDRDILRAFAGAAQRFPHAAAFGAKIYFMDDPDRIWFAGSFWDQSQARFFHTGEGRLDDGFSYSETKEIPYPCGCAFFVSASKLGEIGLLDDDFFLYFEETDWACRARKRGYSSVFVPDAKLWHRVSVSFGGEDSPLALYFQTRNRLLWASRHAPLRTRLRIYAQTTRELARRYSSPMRAFWTERRLSPRKGWWAVTDTIESPHNRAYLQACMDFIRDRLGDCPPSIRNLTTDWAARRNTVESARVT